MKKLVQVQLSLFYVLKKMKRYLGLGGLFLFKDVPEPWQLEFQDAASGMMEEILFFHDQIMYIIFIILMVVL